MLPSLSIRIKQPFFEYLDQTLNYGPRLICTQLLLRSHCFRALWSSQLTGVSSCPRHAASHTGAVCLQHQVFTEDLKSKKPRPLGKTYQQNWQTVPRVVSNKQDPSLQQYLSLGKSQTYCSHQKTTPFYKRISPRESP